MHYGKEEYEVIRQLWEASKTHSEAKKIIDDMLYNAKKSEELLNLVRELNSKEREVLLQFIKTFKGME